MQWSLYSLMLKHWFVSVAHSPSKSFAVVCAAFCVGIAFGPLVPASFALVLLIFLGMVLLCALFVTSPGLRLGLLVVFALVGGGFRYTQAFLPPEIETVASYADRSLRIEGVIDAEVDRRIDRQIVVLDEVEVVDVAAEGKVLVHLPLYPEVAFGDRVIFQGTIELPEAFNGFSYDRYLETKGILGVVYYPQHLDHHPGDVGVVGSILSFKRSVVGRLEQLVSEPHAGYLSGLLFGGSSSLTSDLKDDFSRTGTSHILAASGFNVSLFSLVFLAWILQTPLGRRKGLIVTAFLIVGYVVVAGMTPAVVRAGVMAFLLLLEKWVNRQALMRNVLLLTLAGMLLVNPLLLYWDVGFQLSFVAVTALLVVVPMWEKRFTFLPESFGIRESFVASLAAILATLPIVLWHFASVSLVAPIANLILLPLIPFLMGLTLVMLFVSVVSLWFAKGLAVFVWVFSSFQLSVIALLGAVEWAQANVLFSRLLAVVSVLCLVMGVVFWKRIRRVV